MSFHRYSIDIDLAAMQHNIALTRELSKGSRILGIVKSNAYGHNINKVYPVVEECDGLGVSDFQEAIHLRELGFAKPIVVLNGFTSKLELEACLKYDLTIVIHNFLQIEILKNTVLPKKLNIWMKIDSGMNRLGFAIDCANKAILLLKNMARVEVELLMTHWHSANELQKDFTNEQQSRFMTIASEYDLPVSMSNSSGIIGWDYTDDWVRPGLMIYGVSPISHHERSSSLLLKPVMNFNSKIISIKECKKGEYIGYGATYQFEQDSLIGIVPVGYGDGYPRAETGAPIVVGNNLVRTVGVVSMEKIAVDLSKIAHPQVGDRVVFWGNELPIEEISRHTDRSPYELLCSMR